MKFKDKQSAIIFLSSLADLMEQHNANIVLNSEYEQYWGYAYIHIEGGIECDLWENVEIEISSDYSMTRNIISPKSVRDTIDELTKWET